MPSRLLFVCIANICRSPVAERLMRLRLDEAGMSERFVVASAGVRADAGRRMDAEAERTLLARGGDAREFGATPCTEQVVADAAVVLTATRGVRSALLEESPRALRRAFTLTEFAELAPVALDRGAPEDLAALVVGCAELRGSVPVPEYDVADPYRRSPAHFDKAAAQIDDAVTRIAKVLAGLPAPA